MQNHVQQTETKSSNSNAHIVSDKYGLQETEGSMLEDKRPAGMAQTALQMMADNSRQVKQLQAYQEMANRHMAQQQIAVKDVAEQPEAPLQNGADPIQRKRRNKKANWNQKQIAQNERLFRRRQERQQRYAETAQRENDAIKANMNKTQLASFDQESRTNQLVMISLFKRGFQQQSSSGRAVFNRTGDFDLCKTHAQEVLGALGNNKENGTDVNANGQIKERYMINWRGTNVIVRNFSSNNAINGTIEFQTGVVFEFKYQ